MPVAAARNQLATAVAVPRAFGATTCRAFGFPWPLSVSPPRSKKECHLHSGKGREAEEADRGGANSHPEPERKAGIREIGGRRRMERQDEARCPCSPRQCRICHEDEGDEGCATATAMESPCGCSGSLKYAHRGCVQRWCDEKGSAVCEICLQNYEPGYTVAPKKTRVAHVAVTIRGSLEVPRLDYEEPEDAVSIRLDTGDPAYAECASAAGRSAAWCRSVTVMFTVVLLLRHLIALVTVGAANQYAFSLLTIYLLRASGILLPFYVLMRLISAVQHGQMQYRLQMLQEQRRNASRMHRVPGQGQQQHVILVA